jgi:outer membrane protein TolC
MIRLQTIVTAVVLLCIAPAGACAAETLSAAWSEAIAKNAQLAASQLDREAAGSELAAAGAERLPAVWTQSSYQVRSDERSFEFANPLAPSQQFIAPYAQREAALAAVGVSAPIYMGGTIQNGIKGATARSDAAACAEAATRLDLLLAVASAYIDVLRAQRDLEVAEQSVEALTVHLRNAQSRFNQQSVPQSDVLSAQVSLAMGEQERLRTRFQLDASRARYNRLLSRPLEAAVQLEELQVAPLAAELEELQRRAVELRPDLRELTSMAAAGQYDAERLQGATRPQVSAVGRHDFEENRFQTPQGISSAGVVIDWKFYDGGRSRRMALASQARAASLGKLAEDLRTRIELDVLTEWNNAQEAMARGPVAACALQHAEENYRVAALRYAKGLGTESEVIDSESRRAEAAGAFYGAGYDAALSQLRLRYAVGILGNGQ